MGGPAAPVYADLYARLIPGDGPADLAESLHRLQAAAAAGFRYLYLPRLPAPRGRAHAGAAAAGPDPAAWAARLQVAADALGLPLRLGVSTYLRLAQAAAAADGELAAAALPDGRTVLTLLPRTHDLKLPARLAGDIARRGFTPACFRPETHPEVQRQPELARYLLQAGALLVLDVGSLAGLHGHGARAAALRLLRLSHYALAAGFLGHEAGLIDPQAVRAEVSRLPFWSPRARERLDGLLWERAARLLAPAGHPAPSPGAGTRPGQAGTRREGGSGS